LGTPQLQGAIKVAGEPSSCCHPPATFIAANAASADGYELAVCDAETETTCGTVAGEGGVATLSRVRREICQAAVGRSIGHSLCVPGDGGPVHAEASPHGATGSWKTGIESVVDRFSGRRRSTMAVDCAVLGTAPWCWRRHLSRGSSSTGASEGWHL
jgi:hypothetical protein